MFGWATIGRETADIQLAIARTVETFAATEQRGGFDYACQLLQRISNGYSRYTDNFAEIARGIICCPRYEFIAILMLQEEVVTFNLSGCERYAGFNFCCCLPPGAIAIDLTPSLQFGLSWRAEYLVRQIRQDMLNIEIAEARAIAAP